MAGTDHLVEQLEVFDRVRHLPSELVGAIQEVQLAADIDPHAVEDDGAERAAVTAQRHGQRGGRRAEIVRARHELRAALAHGRCGRRTRIVGADPLAGIGVSAGRRGLQYQVARPPIVNPDRRAVSREQAVGALAERFEPERDVHRARQAGGELVEQLADVVLERLAMFQAKERERREKCVGDIRAAAPDLSGRRTREADDEEPDPLRALRQRQEERR